MARQIVFSPKAARPPAAYSQAVKAAGLVFVSGTAPNDPNTGAIKGTTIQEQTAQCLTNIQAILEEAGSCLDKIVSVTIVLADENDFAGMNEEWLKCFPSNSPSNRGVYLNLNWRQNRCRPRFAWQWSATVTAVRTVKQIFSDPNRKWKGAAPASEVEIRALENVLGVSLPSEYVELLHLNNGGEGELALSGSSCMGGRTDDPRSSRPPKCVASISHWSSRRWSVTSSQSWNASQGEICGSHDLQAAS